MNPQPDPIVGNICAIAFFLMIALYTIKAIKDGKSIQFNDNFVIGHLQYDPIFVNEIHHNHKTVKTVKTKKVIVEKPDFESQQLYADCIDALVALGMKKKEAKNKAIFVFSTTNPQPKTIQEFLLIVLKLP